MYNFIHSPLWSKLKKDLHIVSDIHQLQLSSTQAQSSRTKNLNVHYNIMYVKNSYFKIEKSSIHHAYTIILLAFKEILLAKKRLKGL